MGTAYHACVESFGHGPGRDDVVHDALGQSSRNFVELHELADVVEHLVVLGCGRRHLLDDCRHVTEYGRIQQS